jgi:glucose-6-phosphate 1-dehydrogenase
MTSRVIPVAPFVLTVFGATGDLARRKLLPALFHRDFAGQLPGAATIVGAARRAMSRDAFVALARDAIVEHVSAAQTGGPELDRFLARLQFVAIDAEDEDGWAELARVMAAYAGRVQVYYLATAPQLFGPICEKLGRHGLAGTDARVVIEKPIGKDLASAICVNQAIGKGLLRRACLPDRSLSRQGDGAEPDGAALRQCAVRAALERRPHRSRANHGCGGDRRRGPRRLLQRLRLLQDMVQNHLLQLLCLIAMDPPNSLEADAVRDEKLKVLKSLARIDDSNVAALTVLGQYRAGASNGVAVPGYADEISYADSRTETFVTIKAAIVNWRWTGVPLLSAHRQAAAAALFRDLLFHQARSCRGR